MKTLATLVLAAAALGLTTAPRPLRADNAPAPTHTPQELKELGAVDQFLRLSDAQLDQLLEVIARIRAMTPEQRARLRREITQFRELPAAQRERLRLGWEETHPGLGGGWGRMPPEIRDGWREMIQHATPEQHAAIQAKLQTLSPTERTAYRKALVEEYLKQKAIQP
jgi:Protein of unknown function (DUF3106)